GLATATALDESPNVPDTVKVKHQTRSGGGAGTIAYMSPEQVLRSLLDERSDLFSFGVVLYEMITGARPFPGAHDTAISDAIVHHTPAAPVRVKPDIPT